MSSFIALQQQLKAQKNNFQKLCHKARLDFKQKKELEEGIVKNASIYGIGKCFQQINETADPEIKLKAQSFWQNLILNPDNIENLIKDETILEQVFGGVLSSEQIQEIMIFYLVEQYTKVSNCISDELMKVRDKTSL